MKKDKTSEMPMLNSNNPNSSQTNLIELVSLDLKTDNQAFAKTLVIEYDCQTSLERSLCEVIANSFKRIISVSRQMESDFNLDYPSKEKVNYLAILSKELDRENRNYLNAMNALIEIKSPKMTINVNTENAFLGQNQQFNNNTQKDGNIRD